MSITDLTPKLRESTLIEIGRLRGKAEAEFAFSTDLRDLAAKITDLADAHYGRHVALSTKADEISLRLRRAGS